MCQPFQVLQLGIRNRRGSQRNLRDASGVKLRLAAQPLDPVGDRLFSLTGKLNLSRLGRRKLHRRIEKGYSAPGQRRAKLLHTRPGDPRVAQVESKKFFLSLEPV